jgi:FkbM family methyltransferase
MRSFVGDISRFCGVHVQKHHDPYIDAKRVIKRPLCNVIDGGAHYGTVTAKLLKVFPSAIVHAFEPQQDTFETLTANYGQHPCVKLNRSALSDHVGTARLNINKACYSSLLPALHPGAMEATGRTQDTPLIRLDDWAQQHQIVPELIKLDLQGHELAALRGAGGLLDSGVQAVVTEVNFRPRYEGSCLYHDVAGFLYSKGFLLFRLYEIWGDARGNWLQGDGLFVRAALLQ